jgi:hypothetical protein
LKPISDWTISDIEVLIREKVPEDSHLEYKERLATSKGHSQDPWMTDQQTIGDAARFDLVREIIAFANANGGILILGVRKNADVAHPNTISEIAPLPECVRLADTLRQQCRDLAEPKIDGLHFRGLQTNSGEGVVLISIPQSRSRPHRHFRLRECYMRRGESSVVMTMDEIKDLTLYAVTQEQRIEARFAARSVDLDKALRRKLVGHSIACLRCIVVPLQDIVVPSEARKPALPYETLGISLKIEWDAGGSQAEKVRLPFITGDIRPLVRGHQIFEEQERHSGVRQVYEDGSVGFGLAVTEAIDGQPKLHAGWILGLLAEAIRAAHVARSAAVSPEISHGVELQILIRGRHYMLVDFGSRLYAETAELPIGEITFPRYQIDDVNQLGEVLTLADKDLWNYTERDVQRRLEVIG